MFSQYTICVHTKCFYPPRRRPERDDALLEFARRHPRAGVPKLLIARLWENVAFYERIMDARTDTLSKDQVRGLFLAHPFSRTDIGQRLRD